MTDAGNAASRIMRISWITLKNMKNFLSTASGTAIGTLLYTGFLSTAHEFDWARAAFVGVVCGACSAVWSKKSINNNLRD
jgi:hypothetical protein